jgi:aminoglycoside phosphotransferase (APT) family kinase protein
VAAADRSIVLLVPELPTPSAAVERAVGLAGPAAVLRAARLLAGGTHARTWLIQTTNPAREVVLREFPAGDEAVVGRETRVLAALDGLGGLAPRLLASDASPAAEVPWVVTSWLPGRADITPRQPEPWARQLGQVLARIHATPLRRLGGFPSVLDRPGGSAAALHGPAAALVAGRLDLLADAPRVLTHHDFWAGNTVWDDGILTGVVDWSGAGLGPRGFDVGWCRLDLYLLYGDRVAGQFLDAYQAASRHTLPDPVLWDLWAAARSDHIVESWAPNYRDLGRADLTAAELRHRHSTWTERLLASW